MKRVEMRWAIFFYEQKETNNSNDINSNNHSQRLDETLVDYRKDRLVRLGDVAAIRLHIMNRLVKKNSFVTWKGAPFLFPSGFYPRNIFNIHMRQSQPAAAYGYTCLPAQTRLREKMDTQTHAQSIFYIHHSITTTIHV